MLGKILSIFRKEARKKAGFLEPSLAPRFVLYALLKRDRIEAQVAMHWLVDGKVIMYVESGTPVTPKKMLEVESTLKRTEGCEHVLHVFWTFTQQAVYAEADKIRSLDAARIGSQWMETNVSAVSAMEG